MRASSSFAHFVSLLFDYSKNVCTFAAKSSIMTQLTDEEHRKQMADMKAFDEQMPCIGIIENRPFPLAFSSSRFAL